MAQINIQSVVAYRTIYALTGIKKIKADVSKLHATHYVCCLSYGRAPMWGIFLARTGNLIQCLSSKQEILKQYPGKVLRPMQATWKLANIEEQIEFDKRQEQLLSQVRDDVETPEERPSASIIPLKVKTEKKNEQV